MKQSFIKEFHDFSMFGEHADNFEYIASGKDGDVYARNHYVMKVFKLDGESQDDGFKLHLLENSIYYPKVHAFTNEFMICDRIDGETFYNLDGHNKKLRKQYKNEIEQAIYDAKKVGLHAFDLHNHNIMLTNNGEIRIVDVGRYGVDPDMLQLGFFSSLFGSSRRRHRKHRKQHRHSSSSNHHYRHSSSSRKYHRRHHSSSYRSYSS